MSSQNINELREKSAKGYETCWVVERRDRPGTVYMTWEFAYDAGFPLQWTDSWDRAIKFYDRASCEMMCAEMPDNWDVRILEHQMMFPLPEAKP